MLAEPVIGAGVSDPDPEAEAEELAAALDPADPVGLAALELGPAEQAVLDPVVEFCTT